MTLGSLVTKSLILGYSEGGFITKANLHPHMLTLHLLMVDFPDLIGLIDMVEEEGGRHFRYQRLVRDLFSSNNTKREFASEILGANWCKD